MAKKPRSKDVLSPIQIHVTLSQFKHALLEHLDLIQMPVAEHKKVKVCSQNCHVIERNATVASLKHFIKNMGV